MAKFKKKGDIESFDLVDLVGEDFVGWKVDIQHLGAAAFRDYGFAFQRVAVRHGVDVSEIEGGPKTEAQLDAMIAHLAIFDDICKDTIVKLHCEDEVVEGPEAAERIIDLGIATQVGMKALDCQRLRPSEVLS